jgi:hypothetical protein
MNKVTNSLLLDAESDCGDAEHVAKATTSKGISAGALLRRCRWRNSTMLMIIAMKSVVHPEAIDGTQFG